MTKKVIFIESTRSILDAAKTLSEQQIGSIIVTKNGEPVGIVTDRDIVIRAVAEDLDIEKETVERIMSKPLISVKPDDPIFKVMKLMENHSIRRVPVMEDKKMVGIVTQSDVGRAAVLAPSLGAGIPEIYLAKKNAKSKPEKKKR